MHVSFLFVLPFLVFGTLFQVRTFLGVFSFCNFFIIFFKTFCLFDEWIWKEIGFVSHDAIQWRKQKIWMKEWTCVIPKIQCWISLDLFAILLFITFDLIWFGISESVQRNFWGFLIYFSFKIPFIFLFVCQQWN